MGNARKILIIDDDDELRDSLSEQLSLHEEFETLLAATASDGLKLARNGHVDLVLLDVGLPDLDGREACKLLRRGGFKGPVVMQRLIDKKARGEKIAILRPRRLKPTQSDKLLQALEASLKKVA
jgi:DNA-binding response OmpR family regulator